MRPACTSTILLFLNLACPLKAKSMPPLPPTLDDVRMGVGDMYPLAQHHKVPFRIWVIKDPLTPPKAGLSDPLQSLDRPYLKRFTAELNKRLCYLSSGRFSLRLNQIRFVTVESENSLRDLEKRLMVQSGGRQFTMIVGSHYDGGSYIGRGVFTIASDEVGARPFNRKALHEILHGLISPAHSTSAASTLQQYNPVIGLDPREAAFLGWPERPALAPDAPLFDSQG